MNAPQEQSTVPHRRYNVWVLLGLVVAAVVLGVLNNLRVYEEQRVPWLGDAADEEELDA